MEEYGKAHVRGGGGGGGGCQTNMHMELGLMYWDVNGVVVDVVERQYLLVKSFIQQQ